MNGDHDDYTTLLPDVPPSTAVAGEAALAPRPRTPNHGRRKAVQAATARKVMVGAAASRRRALEQALRSGGVQAQQAEAERWQFFGEPGQPGLWVRDPVVTSNV